MGIEYLSRGKAAWILSRPHTKSRAYVASGNSRPVGGWILSAFACQKQKIYSVV